MYYIVEKKAVSNEHRNAKSVLNLTNGEIYVSQKEAAEKIGVSESMISWVLTERCKTTHGNKLCYLHDAFNHIEELNALLGSTDALREDNRNLKEKNAELIQRVNYLESKLKVIKSIL